MPLQDPNSSQCFPKSLHFASINSSQCFPKSLHFASINSSQCFSKSLHFASICREDTRTSVASVALQVAGRLILRNTFIELEADGIFMHVHLLY